MEEASAMMQGAQGMLVQNWPTVSSAAGETFIDCFKNTNNNVSCNFVLKA